MMAGRFRLRGCACGPNVGLDCAGKAVSRLARCRSSTRCDTVVWTREARVIPCDAATSMTVCFWESRPSG